MANLFCGCCATGNNDQGQLDVPGQHPGVGMYEAQGEDGRPVYEAQDYNQQPVTTDNYGNEANGSAVANTSNDEMTARSMGGTKLSAQEKEKEKIRLQKLVKDFARDAVKGLDTSLVNPKTGEMVPVKFTMDGYLNTVTLSKLGRDDEGAFPAGAEKIDLRSVSAVYKGQEVLKKHSSFYAKEDADDIVALDVEGMKGAFTLFFYFSSQGEKDRFYTCVKILRLSVEVVDNQ